MSTSYQYLVIDEPRADQMWQKLATSNDEEMTLDAFNEFSIDPDDSDAYEYFTELQESWNELSAEEIKIKIAEIDAQILWDISPLKTSSNYGRGMISILYDFTQVVGIAKIDENGGGEDLVTTEEWIAGFRAFSAEKQSILKEKYGGKNSAGWLEINDELKSIRDIAKYCFDHQTKMLVCMAGDYIYIPYFATRAETIYQLLRLSFS